MVSQNAYESFKQLATWEKKAIAIKAGISLQHLYNIFYAKKKPSPEVACKIEKASGFKLKRNEIIPDFDWSIF